MEGKKRKEIKKKSCNEILLSLSIHTKGITPMVHANVINTINFPALLGEREKNILKKSPERKLNKRKLNAHIHTRTQNQ